MTDPEMADATYIEPITWQMVARIIEKERPDALLPTMGGQTALNCALDLAREGVLEKYGVEMIGASREAIDKAEDREKFKAGDDAHRPGARRARRSRTRWRRRCRCRRASASRSSSGPSSRWAAPAAASPTTARSSSPSASAASRPRRRSELLIEESLHRLERVRDGGGARHARTTASSSARSRTSTRWACTPATRSRWRRRRR